MADEDITLTQDNIEVVDSVDRSWEAFRFVDDVVSVTDSVIASVIGSLSINNARALTNTKVRIDFNVALVQNVALSDPASYSFVAISPGAVEVVPQAVELPPGQANPLFVEVLVTEHTDGAIYAVSIVGALEGVGGEPPDSVVANYAGLGDAPNVDLVLATSKNQAQVFFSETMEDNAAIRDVTNYIWDNGLITSEIEDVTQNVVTLRTNDQVPDLLYNLTVRGIFSVVINDKITVTDEVIDPLDPNALLEDAEVLLEGTEVLIET